MTSVRVPLEDLRQFFKSNGVGIAGRNLRQLQLLMVMSIDTSMFCELFKKDRRTGFPHKSALETAQKNVEFLTWTSVMFDLRERFDEMEEDDIRPALELIPRKPRWLALAIYLSQKSRDPKEYAAAALRSNPQQTEKTTHIIRKNLSNFKVGECEDDYKKVFTAVYALLRK